MSKAFQTFVFAALLGTFASACGGPEGLAADDAWTSGDEALTAATPVSGQSAVVTAAAAGSSSVVVTAPSNTTAVVVDRASVVRTSETGLVAHVGYAAYRLAGDSSPDPIPARTNDEHPAKTLSRSDCERLRDPQAQAACYQWLAFFDAR